MIFYRIFSSKKKYARRDYNYEDYTYVQFYLLHDNSERLKGMLLDCTLYVISVQARSHNSNNRMILQIRFCRMAS